MKQTCVQCEYAPQSDQRYPCNSCRWGTDTGEHPLRFQERPSTAERQLIEVLKEVQDILTQSHSTCAANRALVLVTDTLRRVRG